MLYDLIILGGGPGGYLAAERAGNAGLSVLLIEKRNIGGVCLNEGCVPTKTLLYSAKLFDGVAHGEAYGIKAEKLTIDHSKVISRKDNVIKTLVNGVRAVLKSSKVALIEGEGTMAGKSAEGYCVKVGDEIHTCKNLIVATGSSPTVPPIPGLKEGLDSGFVLTNREILSLEQVPKKLAVIGGGVIGLELAAYFNTVGTDVTIIEMLDHIAGENDRDMTTILQKHYEKKGIHFALGAKVTSVGDKCVTYELNGAPTVLTADHALLCIGRRANTMGIGAESINLYMERGAIVTDERMRTNQPNVYAVGDVNGRSMLAHTAYREAEVAVNTIIGKRDIMRYNAIPAVLYTNPELGSVGETEATAKAKGLDCGTVKLPLQFSGRYVAENEGGNGICKLIINKRTNTLVGAQALCNYASEFIVACGTFIELELTLDEIKEIVFPHPTVAEIIREAVFAWKH